MHFVLLEQDVVAPVGEGERGLDVQPILRANYGAIGEALPCRCVLPVRKHVLGGDAVARCDSAAAELVRLGDSDDPAEVGPVECIARVDASPITGSDDNDRDLPGGCEEAREARRGGGSLSFGFWIFSSRLSIPGGALQELLLNLEGENRIRLNLPVLSRRT